MGLVEDFIARYRKEYDFYDQAARLAAQLLETSIQTAGIRAMVTFRAKAPGRLEEKVRQRAPGKAYDSVEDIFRDIPDLAGVRVALYFPGERGEVGKIIAKLFVVEGSPRTFPSGAVPSYTKRFSGYLATHYRVRLRESALNEAQRRYREALIEIQVASVLMHAWAEVEHDLVYKPVQPGLSDEEYSILDELNGLVMAGEIALERLQRAAETRVTARGRAFLNHYDLAAYLLDRFSVILKGAGFEAGLGRVDLLYGLLKDVGKASPERIEGYLSSLSTDVERRPIAEQVIDQLLAEDPKRYKVYENTKSQIRAEGRLPTEKAQAEWAIQPALGRFMSEWISFERTVRRLAEAVLGIPSMVFPVSKVFSALGLFESDTLGEIDRIRRLRNNLVHGVEIPPVADIEEAASRLHSILQDPKLRSALEKLPTRVKRRKMHFRRRAGKSN